VTSATAVTTVLTMDAHGSALGISLSTSKALEYAFSSLATFCPFFAWSVIRTDEAILAKNNLSNASRSPTSQGLK